MFDEPEATTRVYRQYVDLHQSLAAYLLSAGTEAYAAGNSTVRPVARKVGALASGSSHSFGTGLTLLLWRRLSLVH